MSNEPQPNETEAAARGRRRLDPVLLLVLAVGAVFAFTRLDETALWTDEAEAAWLGRSILEHGVPTAFDGRNYLTQWVVAKREDFNDHLVWVLSPWLQLYVQAGSFALFGVSTFTARLPFALMGVACLWLIYRVALRATDDVRVARVAAALLVVCIPFLLHVRQARYYSFAMFATLWAIDAYAGTLERRRWAAPQLVAAVVVLFHSNYGLCVPLAAALGVHALFYARGRVRISHVVAVLLAIAALTLPWAIYTQMLRTAARTDTSYYAFNALHYLAAVNRWALPFVWVALFAVLRPFGWRSEFLKLSNLRLTAAALAGLSGIAFVSINVGLFTRYIINVVPLFVLLAACFVVWFVDGIGKRLGSGAAKTTWGVVLPLSMLTTIPGMAFAKQFVRGVRASQAGPHQTNTAVRRPIREFIGPRHEIFDFALELTRDFDGPLEGVADFLDRNAEPEHTIFVDYGDLPLLFYTDLYVRGGLQGIPYNGSPEWVLLRINGGGIQTTREAIREGYVPIEITGHADTRWENRPDPFVHLYEPAPVGPLDRRAGVYPSIVVYKRLDVPLKDPTGVKVLR